MFKKLIDDIDDFAFHREIRIFVRKNLLKYRNIRIAVIIGISRCVSPAKISKCRRSPTSRNAILTTVINFLARKLAPITARKTQARS